MSNLLPSNRPYLQRCLYSTHPTQDFLDDVVSLGRAGRGVIGTWKDLICLLFSHSPC